MAGEATLTERAGGWVHITWTDRDLGPQGFTVRGWGEAEKFAVEEGLTVAGRVRLRPSLNVEFSG